MAGTTCGTRAPTAKNLVATAIPIWPVSGSRAMIDQVISSASGGVALHAARIGSGAAAGSDLGGGGEAAFRPVRAGLDDVAAPAELVDGCLWHASLDHEQAGSRGAWPERDR